jgi:hypothetical protein
MTVDSAVRLDPYSEVQDVAIAIGGAADQTHVGILYRKPNDSVELLDLGWHFALHSEAAGPNDYCWIVCEGLDQMSRSLLADGLLALYEANPQGIPYGIAFGSSGEYFESNLKFADSGGGGLTCATFVLAVFQRFGFRIVDTKSWRARPEDTQWQERIVDLLERRRLKSGDVSLEYIEAQRRQIGVASRFRPQEVAAAAYHYEQGGPAITFEIAEPTGEEIKTIMYGRRGIFGPPRPKALTVE